MKVHKDMFKKGDKIHVDEIAVEHGLLLGDAVIVESGENANGRYVKFGDGTMICTRRQPLDISFMTAYGSIYHSGNLEWIYPIEFATSEGLHVDLSVGSSGVVFTSGAGASSINSTRCLKMAINPTSLATLSCVLTWLAIGKWK